MTMPLCYASRHNNGVRFAMTRTDAIENLHTICNHFAPTGAVQRGFYRLRADVENEDGNPQAVAIALTGALLDGLRYGNWPE